MVNSSLNNRRQEIINWKTQTQHNKGTYQVITPTPASHQAPLYLNRSNQVLT
jgi:hypothetical protein